FFDQLGRLHVRKKNNLVIAVIQAGNAFLGKLKLWARHGGDDELVGAHFQLGSQVGALVHVEDLAEGRGGGSRKAAEKQEPLGTRWVQVALASLAAHFILERDFPLVVAAVA